MTADTPRDSKPPKCDCCGALDWEYAFSDRGVDLGRCRECGLYYVAQMPTLDERTPGVQAGTNVAGRHVSEAALHQSQEQGRAHLLEKYVRMAERFASPGVWLELGSGTGTLLRIARQRNIEIEGIELNQDRVPLLRKMDDVVIYDRPIESLDLSPNSYSVVITADVFSHLTQPMETLRCIHRILRDDGILFLQTGEIGKGARKVHQFEWELGDHLFFLGEHTIERYADQVGFSLIHRDREWCPTKVFSRDRFLLKGRFPLRNAFKSFCVHTPGVLPLLRWYMVKTRHADNPCYSSSLVLKKTASPPRE